ncbi:MAG: Ig-like domain-containing protein [Armatimonadetes bacterium]|nr:Ig-like domain-containing protein [Armatimonadota bacterium]
MLAIPLTRRSHATVVVAACLAVMLPQTCPARDTVAKPYLLQGPRSVTDGWVSLTGASFTTTELRNNGTAWVDYHRCLLRFDLRALDPSRFGRIEKATLRLTATQAENPSKKPTTVAASVCPWTDHATWEKPNGKDLWPQQKNYPHLDYAMRTEGAQTQVIEKAGLVEFDVTDLVDRWLYQGLPNDGFLIRTGDIIWGKPDAGTWALAFASSESQRGKGPALVVEMSGKPPTPETITQRTLRWYPSPLLPPVRDPYVFLWYFGEPPRFPGAVTNAGGVPPEAMQRGQLPLGWFYGPQDPWLKSEQAFVDYYANAARSGQPGIMVDEWQVPSAGEPSLDPKNPYGITGSIKGILQAKQVNPAFYILVAWRGEDNIEPATRQGQPDLLAIEAYSHVHRQFPREWGTLGRLDGTKLRIDTARRLGMIERTIPWLGMILAPANYHEGDRLTSEEIERQVAELRAYAPEMPGVAFYENGDAALAEACDRIARKHFIDPAPEVSIVEPVFQSSLVTPHVTVRVEAKPKGGRRVARYRWFIDNRLVAESTPPQFVWDLRGETPGYHFVTVHAVDDGFNRAAAQVLVKIQQTPTRSRPG